MKIVLADDNEEMRRTIRGFVSGLAAEFFECADGRTACELFRLCRPDWVLLDWQMEPIDGLTATRIIIGDDPSAKICIVTSFDDEELRLSAIEAGASAFVAKHDLRQLRNVLAAH